jgi:hypothetical protein
VSATVIAPPIPPERAAPTVSGRWRTPVLAFLAVAAVLAFVVWQSAGREPRGETSFRPPMPADEVLGGWMWFDASWYVSIADHGYFYAPGQQSSIAFFPAYPLVVHGVSSVIDSTPLSAMLVTFGSGLAAVLLFWRWCRDRLDERSRRYAVGLLLLYPYAWFLYGAGYADALFLAAALGAFVLLERDRPVAAGLVGAIATAARPVGIAVVVGLVVLSIERRRRRGGPFERRDLGVLLSLAGIGAWCAYLALRFQAPFAFADVQSARGWDQPAGPRTWFKVTFFDQVLHHPSFGVRLVLQAAFAVGFLVLVPTVVRRLGWGYGAYTLLVIGIPLVGTSDFQGVGRYLLAAFPVFAVAGVDLSRRARPIAVGAVAASGLGLVVLTSFFARGFYLT